jgi:hypothetical protein
VLEVGIGTGLNLEHYPPGTDLIVRSADAAYPAGDGTEINRRTEDNVREPGLEIVGVRRAGIWREIEARPEAYPAE